VASRIVRRIQKLGSWFPSVLKWALSLVSCLRKWDVSLISPASIQKYKKVQKGDGSGTKRGRFYFKEFGVQNNRTVPFISRGEFEPFKTSSIFDGTAEHPEWLGEEPARLQQLMPR